MASVEDPKQYEDCSELPCESEIKELDPAQPAKAADQLHMPSLPADWLQEKDAKNQINVQDQQKQDSANVQDNQEENKANTLPSSSAQLQTQPLTDQLKVESDTEPLASEQINLQAKPETSDCKDNASGSTTPIYSNSKIYSKATVENARYSLDDPPSSDHPNEDRHFVVDGDDFSVWCVLDGHNGSRAVEFAYNDLLKKFHQPSWKSVVKHADDKTICEALHGMFLDTEKRFFANMEKYINQKKQLQAQIPSHLTSYAAYMQFPSEVQQLQEIEPMLTGGCTAVVAVVIDNVLYVANVGDSRALLASENPNGETVTEQLSIDHTVENEDELKRLEKIGLCRHNLIKAGRLGTQENTRSIGDYSIKEGYKDIDSLISATSPPGIAAPQLMAPRKLDNSCKYLVLMTDGVYKTIESTVSPSESTNDKVAQEILRELSDGQTFEHLSERVLEKLRLENENTYKENAKKDIRSPLAVACRKRDDMTLIVHKLTSYTE